MSFYYPMFLIGGLAVIAAPLALFVAPWALRKVAAHREHKRRTNKRY